MPLATKNNALIVKDGKVAENCNCCGGWYCFCAMCPNGFAPLRIKCDCTLAVGASSVTFSITLVSSMAPGLGFIYPGCGTYQAIFGTGQTCVPCNSVFPEITIDGTSYNFPGILFIRFASCVNGLINRIEVTGGYDISGVWLSWGLQSGAQNVFSYGENAPAPFPDALHWRSPSEYISQSNPCYLDCPSIGPVPIKVSLPVGQTTVDGTLTLSITGHE
jgi:hypothetical protein